MSTIKTNAITAVSAGGDLSLDGEGTGGVSIASTLKMTKGGDIASASPLVIDTDGKYFDVTGTTNFSAMTVEEGNFFMLQFDGALTITHGSGIELPGAANLTTATGDRLMCYATAANTVEVMSVELETAAESGGWTLGTRQATTSGTAFDSTSIPADTTMILIMFEGVSLSGGDVIYVQLGDSGGFETSGYVSAIQADDTSGWSATTAFTLAGSTGSEINNGHCFLTLLNSSTFSWVSSVRLAQSTARSVMGGGTKSLSAELTQVRITRSGSNTFDAGAINIMYIG